MSDDTMDHRAGSQALGAYVLGALPAAECDALERHLAECSRCRRDVGDLQLAADVLPASVPEVDPPPRLKRRVMAVVRAEAELLHAAGASADRPDVVRGRGWRRLFPRPAITAAAAAAALAAGIVGGSGVLRGGGPGGPARPARLVAARITDPALVSSARASIRLEGGRASLVVHGLPDPPTRRVYQVWVKAGGRPPVPAGATFALRSGTIEIPHRVRGGDAILVTTEPLGGSAAPTRSPLIVSPPI